MPDDIAAERFTLPLPRSADLQWQLLDRLDSTAIGRRAADGAIDLRRGDPSGCFLYGPYLHLAAGAYRLGFQCRCGRPAMTSQPLLGVEVIVLGRFQQEWRDFTAGELADGAAALDFIVPPEHSREGNNEGRFEFRFFHLGNADLSITAVDLEALPHQELAAAPPRRWRMLGRLQQTWRAGRAADGSVVARRRLPAGLLARGGWPYLRLPRGHYRLVVSADSTAPARSPVLAVEIIGDSRWRSRGRRWLRRHDATGEQLAEREFGSDDLAAGAAAVDFAVPTDLSLDAGADAPIEIRLYRRGNSALAIRAVDLVKLADAPIPITAAPRLRPNGRRRVVMIGNCQSETLRQGFSHIEALNRSFEVKYHFVQLPQTLHEFAARDLENCDILLIQDIRLWDEFPLRDHLRPGAESHKFPLVRFASLWPFDSWNGPGDRFAQEHDGPNLAFPYLDGMLGRLRRDIPDPHARYEAYRALEFPGVLNYRRLHQMEERRLVGMDRQFGIPIGDYILQNFRQHQIFHTTVRPNWQVFSLLLQFVAKLLGVTQPIALSERVDTALRNPQVPVHPKVARDLGVTWADETTRYLNRGRELTWDAYVRSYIAHYG